MLKRSRQAEREVRRDSPIRRARTCYDHLAGVAGVQLFGELVRRGWIVEGTGQYHSPVSLTTAGENAFSALRVDVPSARASKRKFGYGCLDWTERQQHLGGALGAEMLKSLEKSETITRNGVDRTARVAGPINEWLDASGL